MIVIVIFNHFLGMIAIVIDNHFFDDFWMPWIYVEFEIAQYDHTYIKYISY